MQVSDPPGANDELAPLASYYRAPEVRARIAQYCGGRPDDPSSMTAVGLAGYGGARRWREADGAPVPFPLGAWHKLMNAGADVCRSLEDRVGTLLLLDVDYTNHDDAGEPYREPARTFRRLEPVYRAALNVFEGHGIHPMVLMTGRGYHFVVKAPNGTPLHTSLIGIGGTAHEGAGRLLEHLAHEVVRAAETELPVSLIDFAPEGGGPFICLDLTAYADPLSKRNTRCAFSSNQKPLVKRLGVRPALVFTLPRGEQPLAELLRARTDAGRAREMAAGADVRIPVAVGGAAWVSAYLGSALADFHRYLDAGPVMDPDSWPTTYDSLDLRTVPACAAFPLAHPNPALLTPGWLRTLSLALWALGWHPRSIAGLVRSRYLQPHGWRDYWARYDPESRARFYVRICCGAIAAGLEHKGSFTCASQAARGLCPAAGCGFQLDGIWDAPRPPWGGLS